MDNTAILYIVIGTVVILALIFGTRVIFTANKDGVSLKSSEDSEKTNTSVTNVSQSKVKMKRKDGHDTKIDKISEGSEIDID